MEMKSYLEETILVYEKKINVSNSRKEYRRQNRRYELYRGRFYKDLEANNTFDNGESLIATENIASFGPRCGTENEKKKTERKKYKELVPFHGVKDKEHFLFPSLEEFKEIIKSLSNWKAAGPDNIYNFFIK
ncbi:hypothetical protein NGRA_3369 [Nosema granulosis]|uniref:Uncharacterized protein n=1 Tax=Nosema granulosis TaxID=83296 RepID=A0A9P6KXK1_9MICR|nr:hypothetical protein NGRA_3369 [Nosema granulosis]